MMFSLCPISALAVNGGGNNNTGTGTGTGTGIKPAMPPFSFRTTTKAFATNQLLSRGMMGAASLLAWAAQSSGSEDLQNTVSIINKWVFGVNGNANAEVIAQIEAMCDQILTEMAEMEKSMNDHMFHIESMLTDMQEDDLHTKLKNSWTAQVEYHLGKYEMDDAIHAFKEYMNSADDCGADGTDDEKKPLRRSRNFCSKSSP